MKIEERIQNLLEDKELLAALAAPLDVTGYTVKQFDFYHEYLGLDFLGVDKRQVSSIEEGFAVLFMLWLHDQNDWIYEEAQRTRKEQFIIEKLGVKEWERWIKEVWIDTQFRYPNVRLCEAEEFQRKFLQWIPDGIPKAQVDAITAEVNRTKWVCRLFPEDAEDLYFGLTQEYYFFAESGVYD